MNEFGPAASSSSAAHSGGTAHAAHADHADHATHAAHTAHTAHAAHTAPSPEDLATVAAQLGRPARGVLAVAARCACGRPTVVRTAPRLDDGTPFPTLYYLTHPGAVSAVSTLEATGTMATMQARLADDEELAAAYRAAHERYLAERYEVDDVAEIHGISAGGMPDRVKCLHVLVGHALAAGPGVNPLGDEALALIRDRWRPDRCTCADPAAG